jgi:hypothetical protein
MGKAFAGRPAGHPTYGQPPRAACGHRRRAINLWVIPLPVAGLRTHRWAVHGVVLQPGVNGDTIGGLDANK